MMLIIYFLISFIGIATASNSQAHPRLRRLNAPYTNATTTAFAHTTALQPVQTTAIASTTSLSNAVYAISSDPPITLPPCIQLYVATNVGLNYWYSDSVEVTVATVVSVYHQYNNTRILASITTRYNPNATAVYGQYQGTIPFRGVPTDLVPPLDWFYGLTSLSSFGRLTWPDQNLVIASPTPFYSLVRLSAWTGYQQGSTCISMSQYGPYTSTATFDPNVGFGSDGPIAIDGNIDYLRLNASPAFIYTGNLSNWVVEVNDIGAGESNIQFPPDFPKILQDVPALRSQFADFSSITIPTVWLGAPTALVSAAEVTAPSSTVIRMPGNYPTSGAEQLTPSTTTSVAVQTSGSEAGWTTYPTSTITQEQTPTTLQSDIASATLDVASIQPDSTSSTSSLTFLTNTPPALTNTAVSEMLSTTIPDESTGTTPASSSAFLRSTAVADIDASQQTNLAPASNGIDNTDGSTPTTSDQSVVSQSSAAGIGDFVASVLGMGSSTAAAAQIPDIGATKTGSQGLTQMQSSVGGEALSESIEAASAIAAMIPVGTGMPDVSPPAPGTLKQGPPTSSQYLGTKPSASASGPSFTNSPLGTALSNIAISTDAQADSTGIYIGSNLLSPSSTIIASDLTFLYAPPESTVLIEYGSTTITYTPSAQPYSIQPASPSTSIHTEPTTGEALLDASGDSITSVPTSGQAMLGASSATLTLGTSSLAREGSSVESTAQALALTQASSTYYLVHSHGSLVVIGSQTLSVGGPAATIGTELVSIASTAIIVNGRSTIPIAGASAAATASHVSSIARASTAGLTKSNGAESAATEGASPTAAGSRHAATSGGVGRFHEAPRAAALAVCFFALVYSCVR